MTGTTATSPVELTEQAARLRLAINRTARRLRQEANTDLGPASIAALATIERTGPLTPSELARIEGIQRPTATRILARLTEEGYVTPHRRSRPTGARSIVDDQRRRSRRSDAASQAQDRLSGQADAQASRRGRRDPRPRGGDPRAGARGGSFLSAAVRRSFSSSFASLRIRNYRLYFGGQVVSLAGNWMQIVAELWLILSLTDSGFAVGIATALQFTGILLLGALGGSLADRFDKRKLLMVTQTGMAVPALLLFVARRRRLRSGLDGLRRDRAPRPRARGRQPGPAGLRDRARRPRQGRQRRQPQQRPRPLRPHHRPRDRGSDHRPLGSGPLLRPQLAELRGDALRPLQDGPEPAPPARSRPAARQRPRRRSATSPAARSCASRSR